MYLFVLNPFTITFVFTFGMIKIWKCCHIYTRVTLFPRTQIKLKEKR